METLNIENNPLDTQFTFGKYKNNSLKNIINSDLGYCQFILRSIYLQDKKEIKIIKDYFKEKSINWDVNWILPFGKYKNQDIREIKKTDKKYLSWFIKNSDYSKKEQTNDLIKNIYTLLSLSQ